MDTIIVSISFFLGQIPGIIIRYLPFHKDLNINRRYLLFATYLAFFVLEIIILCLLINKYNVSVFTFKKVVTWLPFMFILINCVIINSKFFYHMFISCMQLIIHYLYIL